MNSRLLRGAALTALLLFSACDPEAGGSGRGAPEGAPIQAPITAPPTTSRTPNILPAPDPTPLLDACSREAADRLGLEWNPEDGATERMVDFESEVEDCLLRERP